MRLKSLLLFVCFLFAITCVAQDRVQFFGVQTTMPWTTSFIEPGTCVVGEAYMNISSWPAVPRYCSAPNVWSNLVSSGGSSNNLGSCTVTGLGLNNLTCPASLGAGDPSTSGSLDLMGKTSGNIVTIQADDNTAAYTLHPPASVPVANEVEVVTNVAAGVATKNWMPLLGAGINFGTFDPARITAGDCAKFDSITATIYTVISTPCSTGTSLSGGTINQYAYWTGPSGLTSTPYMKQGSSNAFGALDSPTLLDSKGCTFGMVGSGSAPPQSYLLYDCSGAPSGDVSTFYLIDKNFNMAQISSTGAGWAMSGISFSGVVKPSSQLFQASRTASLTSTTLVTYTSPKAYFVGYYVAVNSGTGSVTLTYSWTDAGGTARTYSPTAISGAGTYSQGNLTTTLGSGNLTVITTVSGTINYDVFSSAINLD